jgi:hypothetical protein
VLRRGMCCAVTCAAPKTAQLHPHPHIIIGHGAAKYTALSHAKMCFLVQAVKLSRPMPSQYVSHSKSAHPKLLDDEGHRSTSGNEKRYRYKKPPRIHHAKQMPRASVPPNYAVLSYTSQTAQVFERLSRAAAVEDHHMRCCNR